MLFRSSLWQGCHTEGSPKVKEQADAIVGFIDGRRKDVLAELDSPARDWPQPRRERWRPTADTNALMEIEGSFSAVVVEAYPPNLTNLLGQGSAALKFSIAGQPRQLFTRFGTMASTKYQNEPLTTIRVVASDADGSLRWNQAFAIDPYLATPGTLEIGPFTVQAPLTQSDPAFRKRQVKYPTGTLELTQVSTNLGGTISGKFKINTTAFEEEKKP